MREILVICVAVSAVMITGGCSVAIEKVKYEVVLTEKNCEVRDYAPYIAAETVVDGTLEEAGNTAFGRLFGYISGNNQSRGKIAMTVPVAQEPVSEKIAMTAPVEQQQVTGGWAVSFIMPATYTMETLPVPTDPAVKLRQVPGRRMAVIQYSGVWSDERYRKHLDTLRSWIEEKGFTIIGEPIWARYNPPITPWFLRRNEILIPCETENTKQ